MGDAPYPAIPHPFPGSVPMAARDDPHPRSAWSPSPDPGQPGHGQEHPAAPPASLAGATGTPDGTMPFTRNQLLKRVLLLISAHYSGYLLLISVNTVRSPRRPPAQLPAAIPAPSSRLNHYFSSLTEEMETPSGLHLKFLGV